MYRTTVETLVRDLCFQDEMTSNVRYTEEEIQGYLKSEDPLVARMISASIKLRKLDKPKGLGMERPVVGTKVIALKSMMGFPVGTVGYVYEAYNLGGHIGVSIVFSNGSYCGFGEDEYWMLEFKEVDQRYASYDYVNVNKVWHDYENGYWKFYE